jgi:hypothetical protein
MSKPLGQRSTTHLSSRLPRQLGIVAAVCTVIAAGVTAGMLFSSHVLQRKQSPSGVLPGSRRAALDSVLKRDPRLGQKVNLPTIQDLQRYPHLLPPQGVSILRYCYDEKINTRDVQTIESEAARYPQVTTYVAFNCADPADVAQQALQNGFRSTFLYDRGGELRKALNAFFDGRIYVFDAKGRVVFMDYPGESDDDIVRKARLAIETALREVPTRDSASRR